MKKTIIFIIIVIIAIVVLLVNSDYILKKIYKIKYGEYVEKYSEEYFVDKYLVYAIIKAESNFNEGALSNKGATGLMQLMDNTAKEVAENVVMEYESGITLYNPEKNIKLGIAYFSSLKEIYKVDSVALAAYNAGSGNVNKWIEEGIEINEYLPYLSAYMGHASFSSTFYYIHLLPERLSLMDFTQNEGIIPEVIE